MEKVMTDLNKLNEIEHRVNLHLEKQGKTEIPNMHAWLDMHTTKI